MASDNCSNDDDDEETDDMSYEVTSGLKMSVQGIAYQIKLIMLFLFEVKSLINIGSEVKQAESFDDVVLGYKNDKGDTEYILLQAKHKSDSTKKILKQDLFDGKSKDFDLVKYFSSWQRIKNNKKYNGDLRFPNVRNLIIYTNIDFEEDVKYLFVKLEPSSQYYNKILNLKCTGKNTAQYRLLRPIAPNICEKFQSPDADYLAKELCDMLTKENTVSLRTDMWKCYHVSISKFVLNVKFPKACFRQEFKNNMVPEASYFYSVLKRVTSEQDIVFEEMLEMELNVTKQFGIPNKEYIDKNLPCEIKNEEIEEFFNKLLFAVNQPNELELEKILNEKLKLKNNLNYSSLIYSDCFNKVLNWFKEKDGRFLTDKDAINFFTDMKNKIDRMFCIGITIEHTTQLKEYGLKFKGTGMANVNGKLNYFLKNKNGPKIFFLETKHIQIGSAVLLPILNDRKHWGLDSFIFLKLKTLLRPAIHDKVLNAFKTDNEHASQNLLVVECDTVWDESLMCKLISILGEFSKARLILVVPQTLEEQQYILPNEFINISYVKHTLDDLCFMELSSDSQNKLLQLPIKFQGHDKKLSDIVDARLYSAIDNGLLVNLIERKKIEIWSEKNPSQAYQKELFIDRTFSQEVELKLQLLKDNFNDLLAISVEKISFLKGKISDEKQYYSFVEPSSSTADIAVADYYILNLNDEDCFTNLKKIHEIRNKNVHWIEIRKSGIITWIKSSGKINSLIPFIVQKIGEKNIQGHNLKTYSIDDLIKNKHQPTVIISDNPGTGKSTILTKLVMELIEHSLVIRVNINGEFQFKNVDNNKPFNPLNFFIHNILNIEKSKTFHLTVKLLRHYILRRKENVVIVIDGFEDLNPDNTKIFTKVIKYLQTCGVRLIISTREHMRKHLEESLGVFSYFLQPLSPNEQERLLINLWSHSLEIQNEVTQVSKIEEFAKSLLKKNTECFTNQNLTLNSFYGVPLHIRMLGEIYQDIPDDEDEEGCKQFCRSVLQNPKLLNQINLNTLHKKFAITKIQKYLKKKFKNPENDPLVEINQNSIIKSHELLAVQSLINNYKFSEEETADLKKVKVFGLEIGCITVVDGILQFIHTTVCEYFVATYCFNKLNTISDNDCETILNILYNILIKNGREVVRRFFDAEIIKMDKSIQIYHIRNEEKIYKIISICTMEGVCHILENILKYNDFKHILNMHVNSNTTLLTIAICYKQLKSMKLLLQYGADINKYDINLDTPLFIAIKSRWDDGIKCLIDHSLDFNWINKQQQTSLHLAVKYAKLEIMKILLQKNRNLINSTNILRQTPLHLAIHNKKHEVIEYLIKQKADINAKDFNSRTPFYIAITKTDLNTLKVLRENGADINVTDCNNQTPLQLAIIKGKSSEAKWLVDEGINLSNTDCDGNTALHLGIKFNADIYLLHYLVKKGAPIDAKNNHGRTPLQLAIIHNRVDVVEWLAKISDIDSKDDNQNTALALGIEKNIGINLLTHLVYNKANINCKNKDGNTPIHLGVIKNRNDVVNWLVEHGVDLNIKNNAGNTALHLSVKNYIDHSIFKSLKSGNENLKMKNIEGETPLHLAVKEKNFDVIKKYILLNEYDFNDANSFGDTVLHLGVKYKISQEVFNLFVLNNSDIDIKNKSGKTPFHLAREMQNNDIINWYIEKGYSVDSLTNVCNFVIHLNINNNMALESLKKLHSNGEPVNTLNIDGLTPLQLAVKHKRCDIIKWLVTLDCTRNINNKDPLGNTALHMAVIENIDLETLQCIVNVFKPEKVDGNIQNCEGNTPLHLAVKLKAYDTIDRLMICRPDFTIQDTDGNTAGHLGIIYSLELEFFKHIILNINIKNNNDESLIKLAFAYNRDDIIDYIKTIGYPIPSDKKGSCLCPFRR